MYIKILLTCTLCLWIFVGSKYNKWSIYQSLSTKLHKTVTLNIYIYLNPTLMINDKDLFVQTNSALKYLHLCGYFMKWYDVKWITCNTDKLRLCTKGV